MSGGHEASKPDSTSSENARGDSSLYEKMDTNSEKGGDCLHASPQSQKKDDDDDDDDDVITVDEKNPAEDLDADDDGDDDTGEVASVATGAAADAEVRYGEDCIEEGASSRRSSEEGGQDLKTEIDGIDEDLLEPEDNTENITSGLPPPLLLLQPKRGRGRPPKPGNERRRRTRAKDHNAPKAPINGYVRFLSENRERCRRDNPDLAFASITKLLAHEWSGLKQEEKQKYLDAAERDRKRYVKEVEQYQRTDAYKQFRKQLAEEEAAKRRKTHFDIGFQDGGEVYRKRQYQQQQQQQLHFQPDLLPQQLHHLPQDQQSQLASGLASGNSHAMALTRSGISAGGPVRGYLPPKCSTLLHADNKYKLGIPLKSMSGRQDDAVLYGGGAGVGLSAAMSGRAVSPPTPPLESAAANVRHNPDDTFDIPIFTEEFLDHNKAREAELRSLRKSHTELEEHNAVLAKHIDSFKDAIGRLEQEVETHRTSNKAMEVYLAKLRATLAGAFKQVIVPGWEAGAPTPDNVDAYLEHAFTLIQGAPNEHDKLLDNIRLVVSSIEQTLRDL